VTRLVEATVVAALFLAGCSTAGWPAASPAFTPQAECERNGGWWHSDMTYCEYQSPGPVR
jgi:hypothetical protein